MRGPFLLLNSDLFFHPEILSRVLEESGNILAYDSTSSRGREQTKVAIRERRVVDLGKELPAASARGESLGLLKFDADGAKTILGVADQLIGQGQEQAWVIEATRAAAKDIEIYGVNVAGLHWTEVDFPYDLEQARREVWPAIWKSRWRRLVYWQRTRWGVAALAALVLTLGGWFASTRVGPASVDWETVRPLDAPKVPLRLRASSQTWWIATRDVPVVARVEGAAPVRLEFRLLMPPERVDSGRYVIAVAVDGQPHNWDAFTATPDSQAVLAGAVVGDRDRLEFTLSPGDHIVRVSLVAGHGDRMLVRIRRAE